MGTTATLKQPSKRKSPARAQAPSPPAPPNPGRIFQTINAFQQSAALRAAIELDVFTAIAEGPATVAGVARRAGASERGVRILCD